MATLVALALITVAMPSIGAPVDPHGRLPRAQAWSEATLYRFLGSPDGSSPSGPLVMDASGALYGTTEGGGTQGDGTVFKLTPSVTGYSESVLFSFHGYDGAQPLGGVVLDAKGDIFGTASIGSPFGAGLVYELTPSGPLYAESTVYTFQNMGSDGSAPRGTLALDPTGALYGTTVTGGNFGCTGGFGCGTVFKLVPFGHSFRERTIHMFRGYPDGGTPEAGVILGADGTAFGTTFVGGAHGSGEAYSLAPTGKRYTHRALYSFESWRRKNSRIHWPMGGLLEAPDGTLFGTAGSGGRCCGGAFKLTPTSSGYTFATVYLFKGKPDDGDCPWSGLTMDSAGILYGTTVCGGTVGAGTVYDLVPSPSGYVENVLHSFAFRNDSTITAISDGGAPQWNVIIGTDGALYGTATQGGFGDNGTVFRLAH
jgi:uncharacterized repeat protein (TIGR03803 family)